MAVIKNEKTGCWEVRTYYKDILGNTKQKTKRGFAKKSEAVDWERSFKLQQDNDLNMSFEDFYKIYLKDISARIKENSSNSKIIVVEKKILPYFGKRIAIMFASKPEDAYFEMREKYLDLMADNERLKEENRGLKHKLEQAYEFMKRFVINGKNMLEAFLRRLDR